MKKGLIMKKILLGVTCAIMMACSFENVCIVETEKHDINGIKDFRIHVVDTTLTTLDMIAKVAIEFPRKIGTATRSDSEEKKVKDLMPICGVNGDSVMYVVNYACNNGWVIISGNTDYMPILAYSNKGNFDINNVNGKAVELWIEQEKANIAHIDEAPESFKEQCRFQWLKYVSKSILFSELMPATTRYNSSDALAYQTQCCSEWEDLGYDVYILASLSGSSINSISTSLKNQIISDAYTYGTNIYDGVEYNSFVLVRSNYSGSTGSLITTLWGQNVPYNYYIPNCYPVGCGPLAIAQIMKYWEYPPSFNWTNMPNYAYTISNAGSIPSFLADVNVACNTNNGPNGSGATLYNVLTALHNYGYTCADSIDYSGNEFFVIDQIHNGRPVYMQGFKRVWDGLTWTYGDGHAWVCCGVDESLYGDEIVLKTLQENLTHYTVEYGAIPSYLLYMNWGWDGVNDGYYVYNGLWNSPTDFNYLRQAIINIYH